MSNDKKSVDRDFIHKKNLEIIKEIGRLHRNEVNPPGIKTTREYVDFIDNENPNDKGRDD